MTSGRPSREEVQQRFIHDTLNATMEEYSLGTLEDAMEFLIKRNLELEELLWECRNFKEIGKWVTANLNKILKDTEKNRLFYMQKTTSAQRDLTRKAKALIHGEGKVVL